MPGRVLVLAAAFGAIDLAYAHLFPLLVQSSFCWRMYYSLCAKIHADIRKNA